LSAMYSSGRWKYAGLVAATPSFVIIRESG
jgi:hypothetical protein